MDTGKPPAPPQRRKKVEELQHRPGLVGHIVEKGFSSEHNNTSPLSSFPPPSVLPFPVARHRSHGPHWAPVRTVADADAAGEVEEDKDETDYDPIASFAGPVPRKEKKSLDFRRWRELIPEEEIASPRERKKPNLAWSKPIEKAKEAKYVDKRPKVANIVPAAEKVAAGVAESSGDTGSDVPIKGGEAFAGDENGEFGITKGESLDSTLAIMNANATSSRLRSLAGSKPYEPATPSLADEIDAENRSRLDSMSPDEIAQAQAEIMEKMDPSILEMLKKRGQAKLAGKGSTTASDKEMGNGTSDKEKRIQVVKDGDLKTSNEAKAYKKEAEGAKASPTEASRPVVGELLPSGAQDSRAWKTWSERVEKVRELRFSLDGNIVINSCPEEQTDECSQYKPENVTERDFLRTEGDPGAAGYTIGEAVALIRSMVPAQRSFALQLLASVLDKALNNLQEQGERCYMKRSVGHKFVDWQAVWAYALGPEPEIALALRIALDDNHNSVVLACAKVLQCILSYDLNENFFNISEKLFIHKKDACTAPVFRGRPEVDCGFLRGGFWKYNTKPSNILPSHDNDDNDEEEGKHTIQDDVVVAGQDIAAGLIRMGILPRICYLLEMGPLLSLEEYLVSILISLARHSPTCANAVIKCPRLLQTVVDQYTNLTAVESHPYKTKSIMLLKVLSEADKQICLNFINCGFFRQTMWQLYKTPHSLDDWLNLGREHCKLTSALMVQQLRFWKVCIRYGYCIAYFADFFPAMCFWLSLPSFDKLIDNNILGEFASVATEAFLVLESLSQRLPSLHSTEQLNKQVTELSADGTEAWSWSHAVPMIDMAIKWLSLKNNSLAPTICYLKRSDVNPVEDSLTFHISWVLSAVMHMLSTIINRISPEDASGQQNSKTVPWLPYFVPNIGLEIVKNGFLNFSDSSGRQLEGCYTREPSLLECLHNLRRRNHIETSLSSVCCLHGLVSLILAIDKSIQRSKGSIQHPPLHENDLALEDGILSDGIAKCARNDLLRVLEYFTDLVASQWHTVQSIEFSGRGGPAPGTGFGWGSCGGGFWSAAVLLIQADASLVLSLYESFPAVLDTSHPDTVDVIPDWHFNQVFPLLQKISSIFGMCLVIGPEGKSTLEHAFGILLEAPVLRSLDICIRYFLHLNEGYKQLDWRFAEEDYLCFSKALKAHFRSRWLSVKNKSPEKMNESDKILRKNGPLETIPEDLEMSEQTDLCPDDASLLTEWAHQRLPLPMHWFLSPICTVSDCEVAQCILGTSKMKSKDLCISPGDASEIVESGLFFLLGLETMGHFLCNKSINSPILDVPLVWKLHALSMSLLAKMAVIEEVKIRDIFEILQALYGRQLSSKEAKPHYKENREFPSSVETTLRNGTQALDFQTQVHESYNTFIETFVEQFASISYGNVTYGRQVAIYLHRSVEVTVRLAAWNALSNAHVLELLPPLRECIAEAEGYLEPIEDNEGILEAYAKSWTSGALDRAASRRSMSFTLALHHLSCFIFRHHTTDKLLLRNRLAKSLLRGFSRKHHIKGMISDFINYRGCAPEEDDVKISLLPTESETQRRFSILSEACEGNSSLLSELEKLKSSLK